MEPQRIAIKRHFIHFSFISGTYKPRIRCYDTYQLSLKFERCLDSDGKTLTHPLVVWLPCSWATQFDKFLLSLPLSLCLSFKVVAFDILSDDYSKVRNCEPCFSYSLALLSFVFMSELRG